LRGAADAAGDTFSVRHLIEVLDERLLGVPELTRSASAQSAL
jgi:hypothetical protein